MYLTREGQKQYVGTVQAVNPFLQPDILAGTQAQPKSGEIQLPEGYVTALGFKDANEAIGKKLQLAIMKPITADTLRQSGAQADSRPDTAT
jgi:hypothetical protein